MRWLYLRTDPEHNVNFGYHVTDEIRKYFHLRLWNVYSFFVTYATSDSWKPQGSKLESENTLDKWILSRLNNSLKKIEQEVSDYDAREACEVAEKFVIDELSNWYVRRIRDRVGPSAASGEDKNNAYQTLWFVLTAYSKALSSFIPFISDEIYTNLTGEESVHLADFPKIDESLTDENLEKEMNQAIDLSSKIHAFRKDASIKVRVPFKKLKYSGPFEFDSKTLKLVLEETNVQSLEFTKKSEQFKVEGDASESNLDKDAGEARDIIRRIQEERKKIGTKPEDKISVSLPSWPKEFEDEIRRKALIKDLNRGEFSVSKAS